MSEFRLSEIAPLEVLKLLATSPNYVGCVNLRESGAGGASTGRVYVERGAIVGARAGDLQGIYALYRLLDYDGSASSEIGPVPENERNLHHLTIRRLEEFSRTRRTVGNLIQSRIPTLDARPIPNDSFDGRLTRTLEGWQWRALFSMDGERSMSQIAARAQIDPFSVCQFVLELQEQGLLKSEVTLPQRFVASKIRLAPNPRRAPGRGPKLSAQASKLAQYVSEEIDLVSAAEKANLNYTEAAHAAVELFQTGFLVIPAGEFELSSLTGVRGA